ncbi:MAG TPA: hypothetical protein PK280_05275 [Planctomycetota bacterium]|nr:hypothetical protein [Planctomycetota bacterium]
MNKRDRKTVKAVKTIAGLWLDHRKAVIVTISDTTEMAKLIISKVERQLGRPGGMRSTVRFEPLQVPPDDRRQRRFTGQLNIYYEAVIASVRDADRILIFGPGEATGELLKRLKRQNLRGRVAATEAADRMTGPQIAARARRFFLQERHGQ